MARRPPGMFRRGSRFYFKFKTDRGNWCEHATRTTSLSEAIGIRIAFLRELQDGLLPNDRSKWTLKQGTVEWLDGRKLRVAKGTYSSESSITRTLLRVLIAETKLIKLSDVHEVRRYES